MPRTRVDGHATKHVPIQKNHCFACGKDNPEGMHLKFVLDEPGRRFLCRFRLPRKFQGPPGHAHGGIIATILDEAMGKVNKLHQVIALTKSMEVEYLRPVPLATPLVVESRELSKRGRRHINAAEIKDSSGQVLARSRGLFIAVDAAKMFARHLARGNASGPLQNRRSAAAGQNG